MRRPLAVLAVAVLATMAFSSVANCQTPGASPAPDKGDTAWMLASTALVMLMVPGLALFYGGIVRKKNLLGTMMQSMVALGIVGVLWVVVGYAIAFGDSQGGWFGWKSSLILLNGIQSNDLFQNTTIPIYVHCMYQCMFAIVTPALISGAIAERIKFGPYCIFVALWSLLVYAPLAHWVWAIDANGNPAGWIGAMGALDFAGGTVVHIAAGFSGLAAIYVLRKRIGYPEHAMHPNSMVLTLFGAGILWFGWFGFNGGSGLGIGTGIAGAAFTATQIAAAAAALTWMIVEWLHRGKPTALGVATGLVAGLVGITPASGFVKPYAAVCIGLVASLVCYAVVTLKPKLKYDDSLDAFGVHGVGGLVGALLTGVFASATLFKAGTGVDLPTASILGTEVPRIAVQIVAVLVAIVYSVLVTLVLVKVIDIVVGFCLKPSEEEQGLDAAAHGETAFDFGIAAETGFVTATTEPKPASVPPAGAKRYTVVVDGTANRELMQVWSDLCQNTNGGPTTEFKSVYPHVTTVQGNKFRFSGGDPSLVSQNLARLFEQKLPGRKIVARVEG